MNVNDADERDTDQDNDYGKNAFQWLKDGKNFIVYKNIAPVAKYDGIRLLCIIFNTYCLFSIMIQPAAGILLIADPFLKDPNFMRTVVFLTEHREDGTIGFVLNRQYENTLDEINKLGSHDEALEWLKENMLFSDAEGENDTIQLFYDTLGRFFSER